MEKKIITGTAKSRKKGSFRRKKNAVILLVTAILIGGIWACMEYRAHQMAIQAQLDFQPDRNAKKGTLHEGETQEVANGSFWVLMNQIPTSKAGDRKCNIEYENPSTNHYSARVSLYLKDNGKLLGNTTRVDPGRYVETIELNQDLSVGEYPVRAVVELFQDKTLAGNLSMDVTLWVLEGETDAEDTKAP